MNKAFLVRKIYIYLFSLVGLFLIVFGAVKLVNLGLKSYIFTGADFYYDYPLAKPVGDGGSYNQPNQEEVEQYQRNQKSSSRQRDAAESLAMIIVGLPLYFYHWSLARKDSIKSDGGDA